jgi:predicted nucleic-acid-binding Zn-ribbon protein
MQENNSQNAINSKKLKKALKITTDIQLSEILDVKLQLFLVEKKKHGYSQYYIYM